MEVERMVSVYARKDDTLVAPSCQTTTGIWLDSGPAGHLPRTATPAELGAAVRVALSESRRGVSHPTDWRRFSIPVLQTAGLRSWAALQRAATMCQVEAGSDKLCVKPSQNGGTRGDDRGYHTLNELATDLGAPATDEEMGAAVLSALAACR